MVHRRRAAPDISRTRAPEQDRRTIVHRAHARKVLTVSLERTSCVTIANEICKTVRPKVRKTARTINLVSRKVGRRKGGIDFRNRNLRAIDRRCPQASDDSREITSPLPFAIRTAWNFLKSWSRKTDFFTCPVKLCRIRAAACSSDQISSRFLPTGPTTGSRDYQVRCAVT